MGGSLNIVLLTDFQSVLELSVYLKFLMLQAISYYEAAVRSGNQTFLRYDITVITSIVVGQLIVMLKIFQGVFC